MDDFDDGRLFVVGKAMAIRVQLNLHPAARQSPQFGGAHQAHAPALAEPIIRKGQQFRQSLNDLETLFLVTVLLAEANNIPHRLVLVSAGKVRVACETRMQLG